MRDTEKAKKIASSLSVYVDQSLLTVVACAIEEALTEARQQERRECLDIVNAEIEWGANPIEMRDKIERGEHARQIPGWNCPSEDE